MDEPSIRGRETQLNLLFLGAAALLHPATGGREDRPSRLFRAAAVQPGNRRQGAAGLEVLKGAGVVRFEFGRCICQFFFRL